MAAFAQRTCTFVCVLLVFLTTCVLECSSQAQPQITANGLFIAGQEKTLACYITTAESVTGFPLTWSRGGSNLVASQEQTVQVSGNVRNYNSFYRFTVQPSDNLAAYTCTANLPSGTTSATWTVYVYKGPDQPVVRGPTTVVGGVENSWTCVVDGASSTAPNVYWQYGNGSRLAADTFNNVGQVYRDSNNLEIHNVSSTLTLNVPPGAPNFELACYAVHFDTNQQKSTKTPVTVTYPPVVAGGTVTVTVTAGTTFTIPCNVSANPPLTSITWYKDGARIQIPSGRYTGGSTTAPSLTITNIAKSDAGGYVCSASNSIATTNGSVSTLIVRYIPVITSSQNPVGGVLGGSVTVSCVIDAVPAHTTVRWYRVDSNGAETQVLLSSNPAKYSGSTAATPDLTINNLANSDAGSYRCKVDNNVGRGEGPTVQVQVNYVPRVTAGNQPTMQVLENTPSVLIPCTYDANPAVTSVQWLRNGNVIDTSNAAKYGGGDINNSSLIIRNVQLSDEGVYRCQATNDFGTGVSNDVTIFVIYPPKVTIDGAVHTGQATGTLTVPCRFTARPSAFRIEWTKNSQPINVTASGGKYEGSNLTFPGLLIKDLTKADAGIYVCSAESDAGIGRSNDTRVVINYLPDFNNTTPTQVNTTKGVTITLTCQADSNPPPTAITWYKDGQPLLVSGRYSGGTLANPNLTITGLTGSDAGLYNCAVTNAFGTGSGPSTNVNVQYPPEITSNRTALTGNEGTSVVIPCKYDASPPATSVTWTKNGVSIDVTSSPAYSGSTPGSPDLTIVSLAPSDTATYECTVESPLGSVSSGGIPLTVTYPPKISTGPTNEINGDETTSITVPCGIDAVPSVTSVEWVRNGNIIDVSNAVKYSGGTVSTPPLTIRNLQSSDFGVYQCRATNDVGTSASRNVTVSVRYIPVVTAPLTSYTRNIAQTVTLNCTFDASPRPTVIRWTKDSQPIDVSGSNGKFSGSIPAIPSLTVSNLAPEDAGIYMCSAQNSMGTGRSANVTLTVNYAPIIDTSANNNNAVTGNETGSLTLFCSVRAVPAVTSVVWLLNGSVMDLRNSVKYRGGTLNTPSLTIQNLESSDAGVYKCRATNSLGTTDSDDVTATIFYKPRITVVPTVSANEPNPATLTCTVDALPALTSLVWYKDGQLLDTSSTSRYSGGTTATPSLTIVNVNADDDGNYYCVASNTMGSTTGGTISLAVQYPPKFIIPNTQIGGSLGNSATLDVTVLANPAVTSIQWRKRGNGVNVYTPLNVGTSKYGGGTLGSPSLVINDLSASDIGNYTIVATNAIGERQSVDFVVAVSYPPTTPTITGKLSSYKENDPVTLTCSSDGFPQPQYRWYRGSSQIADGQTLTIVQATPSDNAQFRCEAYNTLGTARVTESINVTYKPRVNTNAVSNVTSSIGQTVTINCPVSANPTSVTYAWFYNGQTLTSADPNSGSLTVTVTNSSDYGAYRCVASNTEGPSDPIFVFVNPAGDGPDTGGGRTGQSTEGDSGLPIATLVLIIIICLIILIVLILICIYCCTTRRCFKKDNNVTPQTAAVAPAPVPIVRSADKYNGHVAASAAPVANGRIDLAEDKAPNGMPPDSHAYGLLISVPGGGTPRPHHLPPLGEEGPAHETESAREEQPKKKKRRKKKRRHHDEEEGGGGSPSRHAYDNDAVEA